MMDAALVSSDTASLIPPVRVRFWAAATLASVLVGGYGGKTFFARIDDDGFPVLPFVLFLAGIIIGVFAAIFLCESLLLRRKRRAAVEQVSSGSVDYFRMDLGEADYERYAEYLYGPGGPWRRFSYKQLGLLEVGVTVLMYLVFLFKAFTRGAADDPLLKEVGVITAIVTGCIVLPLLRLAVFCFAVRKYRYRFSRSSRVVLVAASPPLFVQDRWAWQMQRTPTVKLQQHGDAEQGHFWTMSVTCLDTRQRANTAEFAVAAGSELKLHEWLAKPGMPLRYAQIRGAPVPH